MQMMSLEVVSCDVPEKSDEDCHESDYNTYHPGLNTPKTKGSRNKSNC